MEDVSLLEACRTCANFYVSTTEVDFVHLFNPQQSLEEQMAFVRAELQAWQVHVNPEDGLPQRICANCFTNFCSILNLRQEVANAQTRLLDAIMQAQSNENELCLETQNNDELQAIIGEQLLNLQNGGIVLNTSDLENSSLLQTSEDMNFIQNIANLIHTEQVEEPQVETSNNNEKDINVNINNNNNNNNDINSQNFNSNDDEAMTKSLDTVNVCTTVPENMESMDLDEMLASSIIPKMNFNGEKADHSQADSDCSDAEQEDEVIPSRILEHEYACQYCHCPETGSIEHLIFADSDELSTHFFEVHDPDRPYNCPFCSMVFHKGDKREQHVLDAHANKNAAEEVSNAAIENLECLFCREEVPGSIDLHELNCCYRSDWRCNVCEEEFNETPLYRFRTHQRAHNPYKPLDCRHCERSFVRPGCLATHEKVHFGNTLVAKKFKCDICPDTFTNEVMLKTHKSNSHSEAPAFCNTCNKGNYKKNYKKKIYV